MAHALIAAPTDLPIVGLSWEFLDALKVKPVTITIATGGPLGQMSFTWNRYGDASVVSPPILSTPTASWALRVEAFFADLAWAAGNYVLGWTYFVNTDGSVLPQGGALAGLSCTRYDVLQQACQAATDDAIAWIKPALVPPLKSWGTNFRRHVAGLAAYYLKSFRGLAPGSAQPGDEHVIAQGAAEEAWLKSVGSGVVEPEDVVDSSPTGTGGLLLAPMSDGLVGW